MAKVKANRDQAGIGDRSGGAWSNPEMHTGHKGTLSLGLRWGLQALPNGEGLERGIGLEDEGVWMGPGKVHATAMRS